MSHLHRWVGGWVGGHRTDCWLIVLLVDCTAGWGGGVFEPALSCSRGGCCWCGDGRTAKQVVCFLLRPALWCVMIKELCGRCFNCDLLCLTYIDGQAAYRSRSWL
jgi:hypothetical protein